MLKKKKARQNRTPFCSDNYLIKNISIQNQLRDGVHYRKLYTAETRNQF